MILRFLVLASIALLPRFSFAETLGFSIDGDSRDSRAQIEVRDDQTLRPITDAQVKLAEGMATVRKEGFATVTVAGIAHQHVTVYLKRLPEPAERGQVVISGTMGDYQVPEDGSVVRAGLVFRAPSVFDLLHFEISSLVSPITDTIDVMGERKIPSNLVLPRQDVPVLFTTVELNKPEYRLPLSRQSRSRLVGVQLQIKTDDLVSMMTGDGNLSSPANLNRLTFDRVGYTDPVTPSDGLRRDVPATTGLEDAYQVEVAKPPFKADVMVAALSDLAGDREQLVPTDIKYPDNQGERIAPVRLRGASPALGQNRGVLAIAMVDKGKNISGVLDPMAGASVQLGQFLGIEPIQDFQALPATVGLQAAPNSVASAVFESSALDPVTGKTQSYPIWYVYSLPGAGAVNIPTAQAPVAGQIKSYSVMQLEFSSLNEDSIDGRTIMTELRRFSRSEARHKD